MSLLSVTVKKAQFSGPQAAVHQWNSYVTLKLQHVKSTTVTVKGVTPSWEQDFLFEVNNLEAGLLIEVWNKGLIWDKAAGYHWLHLRNIQHSNVEGTGQWLPLEAELVMRDGEVVGTKTATGHAILIDARFELPYANEQEGDEAVELQRKLEMLNSMLDQEARVEQARKQHQYYIQCESGVSEDSDYTSDVNYPIGQNPNSSASQFLSAANQLSTPQRSLNSSRENSYEKDDDYYRTNGSIQQHMPYYPSYSQSAQRKQLPTIPTQHSGSRNPSRVYWDEPRESETDPLYYNSRPQSNYKSYGSYRRQNSWDDEYNQKRPDYNRQYEGELFEDAQEYSQPTHTYSKRLKNNRRGTPSLERQYTLYEDATGDYGGDEFQLQDANSKSIPYINEPYSSYNQETAHQDSVYNEYNQQYSGYAQDDMTYNEGYTDTEPAAINSYDEYGKDANYTYGNEWDNVEHGYRDQYSTPSASASTKSKELPQIPSQSNRKSNLPSQSPFTSQSTVKEVSVSSPTVQLANQHELHSTSNFTAINAGGGYGNVEEDHSFYDKGNYNNHAQVDHLSTAGAIDAVVPTTATTNIPSNDHSEQYMDTYENQAGYEDWQNYGYYDEAGNYVQYDQNAYYQEETSNLIPEEIQPPQTSEKDPYSSSYYDRPKTAAYEAPTSATVDIIVHPEPETYNDPYDDTSYYTNPEVTQQYPNYDPNDPDAYNSYDQDGYWYDAKEETTFEQTPAELDQLNSKSLAHIEPQSSVEYNYAYHSTENLSTMDGGFSKFDKNEPSSRRASFKRQTSTRVDYMGTEDKIIPHSETNHIGVSNKLPVVSHGSTPTTTTTTSRTTALPTTTNAAAVAASKLTSEIKSALPQLGSLTKGGLSSGFSKLGSFMSSAAAKTGVNVPLITQTINKDVPKENEIINTQIQHHNGTNELHPHDPSLDQGLGHSVDENAYDNWNEQYHDPTEEYNEYKTDHFEQYEGGDGQYEYNENKDQYDEKPPVVHMDSFESNVSEGTREAEDLEAEYWKKQKERIAKQPTLQTQESQEYFSYDNFPDNKKANLLQSMDSTDDKSFAHDDFRQNSLDRDEWLRELEKQSGGQIRPSLSKKDTMSMSLDRTESIDQQTDYGDEYDQDGLRQESMESADAYPMTPPPKTDEMIDDIGRKSSLEIQIKEKGNKSVSFEEEPSKLVPERQTKGMPPREKWIWAINRICANLAKPFSIKAPAGLRHIKLKQFLRENYIRANTIVH